MRGKQQKIERETKQELELESSRQKAFSSAGQERILLTRDAS